MTIAVITLVLIGMASHIATRLRLVANGNESLRPSQSFISVPFANRSNGRLYVGVRVPRS
jgi:hypothetical protein